MRTRLRIPVLLAMAASMMLLAAAPAAAVEYTAGKHSSTELVENPKTYDGKVVTFAGEAIGERMQRGAYAWIHLNDDAYMLMNVEEGAKLGGYNTGMPIWVHMDFAQRVQTFGDYKHEGDVVQVTGVFHAACAEHGGDMDIHARDLVVVAQGHPVGDPIHAWKILLALGLTASAALLWFADRKQRERELKGWLAEGNRRR